MEYNTIQYKVIHYYYTSQRFYMYVTITQSSTRHHIFVLIHFLSKMRTALQAYEDIMF
jgi:hypothetical protein